MFRHRWDITPREAISLQRKLAKLVRQRPLGRNIKLIAGTDCAFLDGGRRIVAVAILLNARTMEFVASASEDRPCTFPYVPGLLSFREAPAIIAAIENLPQRPDLVMLDGQGVAHPRGLGIASHVGLWLDIPTIGVAKSRLCGEHRRPGRNRGCRTQLWFKGKVIGAVVRTRTNVKPLFVSAGHRVTLADAVRWTLRSATAARLPQPTRLAHQAVSRLVK